MADKRQQVPVINVQDGFLTSRSGHDLRVAVYEKINGLENEFNQTLNDLFILINQSHETEETKRLKENIALFVSLFSAAKEDKIEGLNSRGVQIYSLFKNAFEIEKDINLLRSIYDNIREDAWYTLGEADLKKYGL